MRKIKIQYVSDLHLEFTENLKYITENPIIPSGDILLLAGDILCLHLVEDEKYINFFQYLSKHWNQVIWIPGNHEYYGNNLLAQNNTINELKLHDNIRLVNNHTVEIENIRILCTTLWSYIPDIHTRFITKNMNDFRAIKYDDKKLKTNNYNACHRLAKAYLENELNKDYSGNTIILTHHVPTRLHYPPQYAGDRLNYAFASELDYLIDINDIHSWIYGHHHQYIPAFEICDTAILTNQLGYVSHKEHHRFDHECIIEIH